MSSVPTIRRSLLRDQVLIILLLGGAILATTYFGAQRALRTLSRALTNRAVAQTEGELERFFEPLERGLHFARDWGEAGLLDFDDPSTMDRLFRPLLDEHSQIAAIRLADEGGREYVLLREGESYRRAMLRPGLDPARWLWREWGPQAEPREWWSEQGEPPLEWRRETEEAEEGEGETPEPVEGEVWWSQPMAFEPDGRLGMSAAVVGRAADGTRLAYAFDVRLRDLVEFTRGIGVSPNGRVTLLTRDLRLLAVPDDPRFWPSDEGWQLRRPLDLNSPWVNDAVNAFADRPGYEPVRFLSGGEVWWGQLGIFRLSGGRLLLISVILPNDDLLSQQTTIRLWILALTLLVLGGAVLRARVLARRFSEPIEALVRDSERISRGDLEAREEIPARLAEVRQLAEAHDHMRRGLRSLLKLERDLQLARHIQQSTIPSRLPALDGFELAAWSEPAEATGGDTYDVIGYTGHDGDGVFTETSAERAILLLADATGHGVGPALAVTQVRAMLRMAARIGGDLPTVAQHLNEQLYADLPANQFITAWLGELRVGDHSLVSLSAGQGPLLILRASSRRVDVRFADVPPMGIFPRLAIDAAVPIELEHGDVFAVLSDGFFEAARPDGEELGRERVKGILLEHPDASASEILAALVHAVEVFTGGRPAADDRTALVVKRVR